MYYTIHINLGENLHAQGKFAAAIAIKELIYDNNVKVSVDSFGGDEVAYKRFLSKENSK